MSKGEMGLEASVGGAWTQGRLSEFVKRHALAWELVTAGLTLVYVVLAFLQDQGSSGLVTAGVAALAAVFVIEFGLRLYDSASRIGYFRTHWLDIVTCIPVVGPFRALRLVRLVGPIRLAATVRAYGVGAAPTDRPPHAVGLWVLTPILITV